MLQLLKTEAPAVLGGTVVFLATMVLILERFGVRLLA